MTRRTPSAPPPGGLRPLRRRPKQLDSEPTLFRPSRGGGQLLTASGAGRRTGKRAEEAGVAGAGFTDEPAELLPTAPQQAEVDAETLRRAEQIAARLSVPRPPADVRMRRGAGDLASARYAGVSDDIDLDATLEALVANPVLEESDVVVRERLRTRRSVVLVIDVSGSMRGERVRSAAATVGALVAELSHDDLAVVAFWSDAALLVPLGEPVASRTLLETLVRIPAQGLTNIAFPLELARRQLEDVAATDARVLLLSDCVHNAGPDPRPAAADLPRLDVLLDTSGEHDLELARDLTRYGHGRLAVVRGYRDVAPAVSRLFTDTAG